MTKEPRTVVWTFQRPFQWKRVELGFGRRLDAVVNCYGWLWRIDIRNRTLAVDALLDRVQAKL